MASTQREQDNPRNKADAFEAAMMQKYLQAQDGLPSDEIISELEDDKPVRILLPVYHTHEVLPQLPRRTEGRAGYLRLSERRRERRSTGGAISVIVNIR